MKYLSLIVLTLLSFSLILKASQANTTKRLFIAIDVPNSYEQGISNIQKFLSNRINNFKPEKPHVTLLFLGDTDSSKIQTISETLNLSINEFLKKNHFMSYTFQGGAKIFGKNAIVLEYDAPSEQNLKKFLTILLKNLITEKIITDQQASFFLNNFKPHITLGRINPNIALTHNEQNLLTTIKPPIDQHSKRKELSPMAITLYESKSGYIPLYSVKLEVT